MKGWFYSIADKLYGFDMVNSNTVNPKFHLNQTFFINLLSDAKAKIQRDKSKKFVI